MKTEKQLKKVKLNKVQKKKKTVNVKVSKDNLDYQDEDDFPAANEPENIHDNEIRKTSQDAVTDIMPEAEDNESKADLPGNISLPKISSEPEFNKERYIADVRRRITANKMYPNIAKKRGIQGQVVIKFVIKQDGSLKWSEVNVSSGFSILDNAALAILEVSLPFERTPEEIHLTLPIVFQLG